MRLFVDCDGREKADVTGPVFGPGQSGERAHIDRCLVEKEAALMAAIRIANANDAEIVVVGDEGSWDARWGVLIRNEYFRP
jgi:hypothetical protein